MTTILFDLEADALLDKVTKIHCIWTYNTETKEYVGYSGGDIKKGVQALSDATKAEVYIDAFNGFGYDFQVLLKLYPDVFQPDFKYLTDTCLKARLVYSDIYQQADVKLIPKGILPASLGGAHSLKAWGMRLGVYKDEYKGGFEEYNKEMDEYCKQDVAVLVAIHEKLKEKAPWASEESPCFYLEKQVRMIMSASENYGVYFDVPAALTLNDTLAKEYVVLEENLKKTFGYFYTKGPEFTPKQDNKKMGYMEGAPFTKLNLVEFNPQSRQHIIDRFQKKYGHTFTDMTEKGNLMISDEILDAMEYPEAKLLVKSLLLKKRIAALSSGDAAWLALVDPVTSRIHGRINTQGTPTGRATHSTPNLAQVPSVRAEFGKECRALFCAPEGRLLVGADLSGLELRCLGHYLFQYDDGEYIKELLHGDIHTKVQNLVGLATRAEAKTLSYALIYGAGNGKLGKIVGGNEYEGKLVREKYMKGIKGFDKLMNDVGNSASQKGYLVGPDGRQMPVRSQHSALNTLLQGCGAIIAKKSIVCLHDTFKHKLNCVKNSKLVLWVHDEVAIETTEELAEEIGKACVEAFETAGRRYKIACPITGEYRVGKTWADIH